MNWLTWALLSAVFAAVTAVLAKVGVTGINSHVATAIRTTIVLVFTWGIAFAGVGTIDLGSITRRQWLCLAMSGIATGLSWLCYFRALQLGEVSKVAPIDKLSVVLAVLLAVGFLGERVSVKDSGAIALIACGSLLLAWK